MLRTQDLFSCLGERTRLLSTLLLHEHRELCVCELMVALDNHQSRISRHLATLRHCEVLADRRQGQWVFYRLHPSLPRWALGILDDASDAEAETLKQLTQRLNAMQNRPARELDHA